MRGGVTFAVRGSPRHGGLGQISETPLTIGPANLILGILTLRAPGFGPGNFTVDYYLRTVLFALDYGLASGKAFKLNVERENYDLRRVLAEALGMAVGTFLIQRDLGATWQSMVQIDSRHLIPGGQGTRRRPDIFSRGREGSILLECKGTTAYTSVSGMLSSAYQQVKNAQILHGHIDNRYLTCAFTPLLDDHRNPSALVGDPRGDKSDASMIFDGRVAEQAYRLHYARVANMAGLPALAALLWSRAGEQDGPSVSSDQALRQIERAQRNVVEFDDRQFIGRTLDLPVNSPGALGEYRLPTYRVSLLLESELSRVLVRPDSDAIDEFIGRLEPQMGLLKGTFQDGSAIDIGATADGEAIDPTDWWFSSRGIDRA